MSNIQHSLSPPSIGQETNSQKLFSCLVCRQRKVKCDRVEPCSNCIKAGVPCNFVPPAPSRRRRRKPVKEGLHARLQRYERILKSHGVKIDDMDVQSGSDESGSEDQIRALPFAMSESSIKSETPAKTRSKRAKLIGQSGKSRYLESDLWSTLTEEINNPGELFSDESEGGVEDFASPSNPLDENALLLGMSSNQSLKALHPPKERILQLWQLFKENVDPLTKIVHAPTLQKSIETFANAPYQLAKGQEALFFSIYLSATISVDEDECLRLLGERKEALLSTFRLGAQQALVNAAFLKSSNIVVLQAYNLFLTSMRPVYDTSTLLCLSGVGVRIARRIGLHRDGSSLGLRPFDVEIRRRLWWTISTIDCRLAELCGTQPSQDLMGDTKSPLNLNDTDLSPEMTEYPPERQGVTDMVFVLAKCHIADGLKDVAPTLAFDALRSANISLAAKIDIIDKLQDRLEQKILRFCDPLQPLHVLTSILCRAAICKLRLSVQNPFSFARQGIGAPQSVKDMNFENGKKVIEYGNLMHTTVSIHRYSWCIGPNFLWDALIYTLIEIRGRKTQAAVVDKVWIQIGDLFRYYPAVIDDVGNPLYIAVGIWTVKVWEECAVAKGLDPYANENVPDFIARFRRNRSRSNSATPNFLSVPNGSSNMYAGVGDNAGFQSMENDKQPNFISQGGMGFDDESNRMQDILYFPPESLDWTQLDYLFRVAQ